MRGVAMKALAVASRPASAPSASGRVLIILAVFAGVAPLATVAVILSLMLGIGMTVPERVPDLFPYQWAFCMPVALISGALFGWAAVRGRPRLWIALAPALLMPPVLAFVF